MNDPRSYVFGQLDRLLGFYGRVEAKAAVILAVDVWLLASVAVNIPFRDPDHWYVAFAGAAAILLCMSMVDIYRTLFPHLKGGRVGLLYFGDISKRDSSEFIRLAKAQSDDEIIEDGLCQVWRNAEILTIKFARCEAAFKRTVAALPFWLVFIGALSAKAGQMVKLTAGG